MLYYETNWDGMTLLQSEQALKLTADAVLLSRFATLHSGDRVCDLGCGVGNILIGLALRHREVTLDGVELRPDAAHLCRENLRINGLKGTIVTGDLNDRFEQLPWGGYHLVVANPPYFPMGTGKVSPTEGRAVARTEGSYTLAAGCAAAGRLCRFGGKYALCLPPERLGELFVALKEAKLEPKRLQFIQTGANKEARLALVEAQKGAKPGLRVLPVNIE